MLAIKNCLVYVFNRCKTIPFGIQVTAFIAFLALFVSIDQAYQMRKHNRLSVKPYLTFGTIYAQGNDKGLILENDGFGPARIEKISLYIDARLQEGDAMEIANLLANTVNVPPGKKYDVYAFWFNEGTIIKPGEKRTILSITKDIESNDKEINDVILTMHEAFSRIGITIDYVSLYEEKFYIAIGKFPNSIHKKYSHSKR